MVDRYILTSMDMYDSNLKYTSADEEPMRKHIIVSTCAEIWIYMSIVGMLL